MITVKGQVKDQTGFDVIGASVVQRGTTNGTTTDMDGRFCISVPSDAELEFQFVGYQDERVKVQGRTVLNVVMKEDASLWDGICDVAKEDAKGALS